MVFQLPSGEGKNQKERRGMKKQDIGVWEVKIIIII
jgi:hypothetical protein